MLTAACAAGKCRAALLPAAQSCLCHGVGHRCDMLSVRKINTICRLHYLSKWEAMLIRARAKTHRCVGYSQSKSSPSNLCVRMNVSAFLTKRLRRSVFAVSFEYFVDPSFHPPMANRTFLFYHNDKLSRFYSYAVHNLLRNIP